MHRVPVHGGQKWAHSRMGCSLETGSKCSLKEHILYLDFPLFCQLSLSSRSIISPLSTSYVYQGAHPDNVLVHPSISCWFSKADTVPIGNGTFHRSTRWECRSLKDSCSVLVKASCYLSRAASLSAFAGDSLSCSLCCFMSLA